MRRSLVNATPKTLLAREATKTSLTLGKPAASPCFLIIFYFTYIANPKAKPKVGIIITLNNKIINNINAIIK